MRFPQRIALRVYCTLLVFLFLSSAALANELRGRVFAISDGDTLSILDDSNVKHEILLLGIEAPEISQRFGIEAKKNLSNLIYNKTVNVKFNRRDRYGRIIGTVTTENIDVGREQLRVGFAWHHKNYANDQSECDFIAYSNAENIARLGRVGMWTDSDPIAPWDYRHSKFSFANPTPKVVSIIQRRG